MTPGGFRRVSFIIVLALTLVLGYPTYAASDGGRRFSAEVGGWLAAIVFLWGVWIATVPWRG